ncbi:carbohydrate-binding family 9-like protein [Paenibacillus sp. GCM10027628]|uniref:carbohydrate-binding family 9-like protein n=1 Tax=Paenibacillus sp. GCM10027628 TaxID=3273413 RepID=UPI003638456E
MIYKCRYIDDNTLDLPWESIEAIPLREVVTGENPRLQTRVRACWTQDQLNIRFECEDDHIVATMVRRDDPIYMEDVVEVFIDTAGTGRSYYEFEVSPRNIVFDALIHNDLAGSKTVDTSWDAAGLMTQATEGASGWRHYELRIPFEDLGEYPQSGTRWRWNLYRIDDDRQGTRHYWAWSPTGAVDYHIPQRFGTIVFVK